MKRVNRISTLVVSAFLCVSLFGCDKNINEDANTSFSTQQDTVVISKAENSFTDEQNPVFRDPEINTIQHIKMLVGFDFPQSSEIVWNYSCRTSFTETAQEADYKPYCTVCDVSVPLSEKNSLLSSFRKSMHEAPADEITGWQSAVQCKGGILTDKTERYDFFYEYDACDDSSENVPCICEAAVYVLDDRIAVVISDGAITNDSEKSYEPTDILTDYYVNSLSRGRVCKILRKPNLDTIADIQVLLNLDLPSSAKLGTNMTYENNDPDIENNTGEYKPYGYLAEITVASDDTDVVLEALKNQSTQALTGHTTVTDKYASVFKAEYLKNISDDDELHYFEREYDANESPTGRCPVTQYIYVFSGKENTTLLVFDPAYDLPE